MFHELLNALIFDPQKKIFGTALDNCANDGFSWKQMVDMKYVNSVWRPLKKQSVNHRKQKIYISSENKRHAQEGSCLETGFFWNTKGAIQSRGGKMCLQTLFTCLFCSQHCRWGLLVELLASQYPMNLHTMWNQLKRKWIFKQDDNDWKYIIHTLNKHNRCKK